MIIWIIGDYLAGYMALSGAYEVYVNSELIFSKLLNGHIPPANIIFEAIERILRI